MKSSSRDWPAILPSRDVIHERRDGLCGQRLVEELRLAERVPIRPVVAGTVFGEEAFGLPVGRVFEVCRRRVHSRPNDQFVEQIPGVGFGAEHGPGHAYDGRLVEIARGEP